MMNGVPMHGTLEKLSITATRWIGTTSSLILHTIFFIVMLALPWLGVTIDKMLLILTTAVSLEAIYLAIFIQMTVNRHAAHLKEVEEDIEEIADEVEDISDEIEDISEEVDDLAKDMDHIQEEFDEDEAEDAKTQEALQKIEDTLQRIAAKKIKLHVRSAARTAARKTTSGSKLALTKIAGAIRRQTKKNRGK